jgi:hypothetical protein
MLRYLYYTENTGNVEKELFNQNEKFDSTDSITCTNHNTAILFTLQALNEELSSVLFYDDKSKYCFIKVYHVARSGTLP